MIELSDTARCIAGAWFGMMRPDGKSHLRFGMVESRPTAQVQAALDELVVAGVISREVEKPRKGMRGLPAPVTYRPLVDCHEHLLFLGKQARAGKAGIRMVEPIK